MRAMRKKKELPCHFSMALSPMQSEYLQHFKHVTKGSNPHMHIHILEHNSDVAKLLGGLGFCVC